MLPPVRLLEKLETGGLCSGEPLGQFADLVIAKHSPVPMPRQATDREHAEWEQQHNQQRHREGQNPRNESTHAQPSHENESRWDADERPENARQLHQSSHYEVGQAAT